MNLLIELKAEDTITDGTITVKIYISGEIRPYTFSITFENSLITEFKGTDESSETNGKLVFTEPTLNGKTIKMLTTMDAFEIAGAVIVSNSCIWRMTYNVNDVEVLDEKITALAEISHSNDVAIKSMQSDYVNKNELVRDDRIDIIVKVDKENNNIIFEAEDNINTGLLIFQIYEGNDTKQFRRKVYTKVIEGQIFEYKGAQENMTVNDPTTGEKIELKLMAHSEEDRVEYFPTAIIERKTITIDVKNEYKIVGVVIEYNSFKRHLTFTPNDLVYRIDIEALDNKINALAEQSHSNDAAMLNEFTTVNEVNEVLANNYVLKSDCYTKTECDNKYALKSGTSTIPDLSDYRKINDLSVNTAKHIELTRIDTKHYKSTEFYDHLHSKGIFIHSDGTIEEVDMQLQKLSLSTSGPTSEATSKDTYAYIAPIKKILAQIINFLLCGLKLMDFGHY